MPAASIISVVRAEVFGLISRMERIGRLFCGSVVTPS